VLGFVIGWLLRGMLRPTRPTEIVREVRTPAPSGTRVLEVDTGEGHTRTGSVPIVSGFAPPPEDRGPRGRVVEVARRTAGGLTPPHDNLARIHGIGPKIAALLVDGGITSFRQVARLTPEDIAILNDAIGVFPGRIDRDGWISSARELHREVYGSEP
jgi:predicted flap endonuclease-1-like 5' DNA nuclease